jgi:hypothetical protein
VLDTERVVGVAVDDELDDLLLLPQAATPNRPTHNIAAIRMRTIAGY